ncbi:hypothetical protein BC827DRAFT_1261230 [Russula dissimulans]|nr:hypothetical protein BC827DRAFT_1261230 [Russula dissimulans]
MADVRALLKAKRQEAQARITHPYAAYGANGALRCTACGGGVKFASAWEGHLGSRAHRAAVAELKAKEGEQAQVGRAIASSSKRKAEGERGDDDGLGGQMEVEAETAMAMDGSRQGKRQRTEEREIVTDATAHAHAPTSASRAFPADFFSDPARKPSTITGGQDEEEEEEEEEDKMDQDGEAGNNQTTTAAAVKSQFAMEWDAFERDLQNLQLQKQKQQVDGTTTTAAADPQETYARATIAAEPELVPRFVGLPEGAGAGALQGGPEGEGGRDAGRGEEARKVSSDAEERRNKEMEERELIIDRLVEEERAQEDAYNRVAVLRNRVQMLKQKRELAKAKGKGKTDAQE